MLNWLRRFWLCEDDRKLLRDLYAERDMLHTIRRAVIADIKEINADISAIEQKLEEAC